MIFRAPPPCEPRFPRRQQISIEETDAQLRDRVQELVEHLRPPANPGKRIGTRMEYGTKGGLKVEVLGKDKGRITPFDGDGKGRSPIQFIQYELDLDKAEAIQWAIGWLGISDEDYHRHHEAGKKQRKEQEKKRREQEAETTADKARRTGSAIAILNKTQDAAGTHAEAYLQARGINLIPPACRYHPALKYFHDGKSYGEWPVLVLPATDIAGNVKAIQRIYLNPEKPKQAPLPNPKKTLGPLDGAAARFLGPNDWPMILAEGPETGLSVWQAMGWETWVALGSIAKLVEHLPLGRRVIVARDGDEPGSPSDKMLSSGVDAMIKRGIDAWVATPPLGQDFNDVLQAGSDDAVRPLIDSAVQASPVVLYPAPSEVDINTARLQTRQSVDDFMVEAENFNAAKKEEDPSVGIVSPEPTPSPPVHALKIDLGVGKSRATVEALAGAIRSGAFETAFYFVPLHVLADELVAQFNLIGAPLGLAAKPFRGRSFENEPGEPMCPLHEEAAAVAISGGVVAKSLCRYKRTYCEHHPDNPNRPDKPCRYIMQTQEPATLWLLPHQFLFKAKPAGLPGPDLIVIDEAYWQSSLHGVGETGPITVTTSSLNKSWVISGRKGRDTIADSMVLDLCKELAIRALESHFDGPLFKQAFIDAGLDAEKCRQAATSEYSQKAPVRFTPGMAPAARRRALESWRDNGAMRLGQFWQLLGKLLAGEDEQSPHLTLERNARLPEGVGTGDVIHMRWSSDIVAAYDVPTLILDATLSEPITRRFFPQLYQVTQISVEKPHQKITQITDRAVSASMIRPSDSASDRTNRTRRNNIKLLHRLLKVMARDARVRRAGLPDADGIESTVDVLCVGQKGVDEALNDIGEINGVRYGHFNNLRGVDRYGGVDSIVVVGRLRPGVSDVEHIAMALFERPVTRRDSTSPVSHWVGLRLSPGAIAPVQNEVLTDPLASEILFQIREAELIQMIGRGRGVNRTADNPLNVLLLTNVALPVTVDSVTTWDEVMGERLTKTRDGNPALPKSPSELTRCFPEAFPTAQAARDVLRGKKRGNSYKYLLIGESPRSVEASYKRTPRRTIFSSTLIDNRCCSPRDALESVVGPVAEFSAISGATDWHELKAVISYSDGAEVVIPAAVIMRVTGRRMDADEGDTVVRLEAVPSPEGDGWVRLKRPGSFKLDMRTELLEER